MYLLVLTGWPAVALFAGVGMVICSVSTITFLRAEKIAEAHRRRGADWPADMKWMWRMGNYNIPDDSKFWIWNARFLSGSFFLAGAIILAFAGAGAFMLAGHHAN